MPTAGGPEEGPASAASESRTRNWYPVSVGSGTLSWRSGDGAVTMKGGISDEEREKEGKNSTSKVVQSTALGAVLYSNADLNLRLIPTFSDSVTRLIHAGAYSQH